MELFLTIAGAILAVFVVILIHEWGHFIVAKAMKVQVLRFSIGFGKAIWSYRSRSGTEYVIASIPLGGYVKMQDETYNRQPLVKRIAIVIAGPLMNFVLAIFCFWIIYLMGVTTIKPVIGQVLPNSIAEQAGFKSGDEIKAINHRPTGDWQAVMTHLIEQIGNHHALATIQSQNSGLRTYSLDLSNLVISGKNPDVMQKMGIVPFQPLFPAVVEEVMPDTPAAKLNLQANDRLVAINGKKINDWPSLSKEIHDRPNQEITLTIQRNGAQFDDTLYLGSHRENGNLSGYLGVAVHSPQWPESMLQKTKYNPLTAVKPAIKETKELIAFNYVVLEKMIRGIISISNIGGPITVFESAGEASKAGLKIYLSFIAFISVTLGFINILPIPGLDGGHLLFQVIEGIMRRPLPEVYQLWLIRIGFILIILLMVQGTINDLIRLF